MIPEVYCPSKLSSSIKHSNKFYKLITIVKSIQLYNEFIVFLDTVGGETKITRNNSHITSKVSDTKTDFESY